MKYIPRGGLPFTGIRTFMRLPHCEEPSALRQVDFALLGLPFDLGTTYASGARFGPTALRASSVRLSRHNMSLGVNVFNYLQGLDYGDVQVILGQTEPSYELITEGVLRIVEAGAVPVCMGGDHSVTLPELRAVAAHHGAVALVHLDAHPDTWDELYETEYNHGTPMRRAVEEGLVAPENSVHVGLRGSQYDAGCWEQSQQLGFELLPMEEVDAMGLEAVVERIRARTGDRAVFLSVDIDVLDPAYAPGTGTPEVGGFTTREALRLMRGLAGLRFVGFDLVELLPAHDSNNITALAGAQLIFEFLSLLAVERRNAVEPG